MERLDAIVESTVFRNPENGYTVLSVRAGRSDQTVVGSLPELSPGEQVTFTGEWTEHRTYGRQFRSDTCEIHAPTTLLGIERYLGGGLFRGVGPTTAAQIVERFKEDTLTILSEHPERLLEVPGIGAARCAMITQSFQEHQISRQSLIFLQSYGVPPTLAVRISQFYGANTKEVVLRNPYQICTDLEGVGFRTADRIGLALGTPPDSEGRIIAALRYVLQDAAASAGHVYLPEDELCDAASELLQVAPELCARQLRLLLLGRRLIAVVDQEGPRRIYLLPYWRAEQEVAQRLLRLMAAASPDPFPGAAKAIRSFERAHGIAFSPTQRQAIIQALGNGVFVITGGPGTGKTTIINCILTLLGGGDNVSLCAPTGRAAKRMTEATGDEAQTIHRLLEYSGEDRAFSRDEDNPLDAESVIADEASMIDLMLMRSLLRAMAPGSRLILVGDADQLPSVGAGNVLGDILDSGEIPCVRLTEIYRQSEASRIVLNAHRINRGEMPLLNEENTDFFFQRCGGLTETAETIVSLVTRRLPGYLKYPEKDRLSLASRNIQVLAPARKGECGVRTLNLRLQAALNPPAADKPQLTVEEEGVFRLGDKVIQTENDYDLRWVRRTHAGPEEGKGVFNGDVGIIIALDSEAESLTVRFDEERDAVYGPGDLHSLELAYCLSVHKSQGSEFPVVVMPVVPGPPMLLTRNLLYTAMTRARSLVVLAGREEIIQRMVENDHEIRRYTALAQRLREIEEMIP